MTMTILNVIIGTVLICIQFQIGVCQIYGDKSSRMELKSCSRRLLQESQTYVNEYIFAIAGCNPTFQNCLEDECEDEEPEGAPFNCSEYSRLGLCTGIPQKNCQSSCGRCILSQAPKLEDFNSTDDLQQGEPSLTPKVEEPISTQIIGDCAQVQNLNCDISALLKFKEGIIEGQELLSTWTGNDPCNWRYIQCTTFNDSKRVTNLQLEFLNTEEEDLMQGSLVPEFSNMRFLEELAINYQDISGQLFTEYSALRNLKIVNLASLNLRGKLPIEYSIFSNLTEFVVSFNRLSGSMPKIYSVWNSLERFLIAQNKQITGSLNPEFSTWKNIIQIDLGDINTLRGTIPPEYSEFKKIIGFGAGLNLLSGPLPEQFSTWVDIQEFLIPGNLLIGNLPENFSVWKQCDYFSVAINRFTGQLPVQYSQMRQLKIFDVTNNNLKGSFPVEYSILIKLDSFNTSGNGITGQLPVEWSKIIQFADIRI